MISAVRLENPGRWLSNGFTFPPLMIRITRVVEAPIPFVGSGKDNVLSALRSGFESIKEKARNERFG
jgi:hypothetical protein